MRALVYFYRNWISYRYTGYDDEKLPIVLSIANLRAYDESTPVYLVDQSDCPVYWDDFPQKLNFKVIRQPATLRRLANNIIPLHDTELYWSLLTKPIDVYNFALSVPESVIIPIDADIFFLQNPWPLENSMVNQFCCAENTGFYYFDKVEPIVEKVFELWKGMCFSACFDPFTQWKMIDKKHNVVHDESVWCYILSNYSDRLPLTKLSYRENFRWRWLRDKNDAFELDKVKILHLGDVIGRERRGIGAMCVKEIRDAVTKVLSPSDIEKNTKGFEGPIYSFKDTKDHFQEIKDLISSDDRFVINHKWFARS